MGRVRRYKKLKSCDPFYRGPKTVKSGIDLPPSRKNDQASNSFRYFVQSQVDTDSQGQVKMAKIKKKNKQKRVQNIDDQEIQVEEDQPVFKRQKGESDVHFLSRVDVEANQRLMSVQKKNRQRSDKRKRYNKERKLKYQLRKLGVNLEDAEGMDFKDLKDHVSFGEVVQRPPELTKRTKRQKMDPRVNDEREKIIDLYRNEKRRKASMNNN